jgi:para-nitrobenzyl esterase
VIDAYRESGAAAAIWRDVYTDLVFRAPILHLLGRSADAGVPAWAYEFAHPIASADGGSPHATDVPFVFGTHRHPHFDGKIGDASAAAATSAAMMAAWAAFVRDGRPTVDGQDWPRYRRDQPLLMRFGDAGFCTAVTPDRGPGLACWPAYS